MQFVETPWVQLGAAIGIGLLIGLERERRKGEGPRRIPAGIRTFAVASTLGAAAVMVGGPLLLTAAALGVAALAAVAYWRSAARDPGVTTGVSLVLTAILGGLAMSDTPVAAALAVVLAALLAGRTRLHNFVRKVVSESELNDALMLAAAVLVVLPLVPDRYVGPFAAFNPRTAWSIVILMMVVGALGHVAQRLLGSGVGLAAAGLASGFVSGIVTVAAMGERAAQAPGLLRPAVAGAVLSSVATVVQMAIVLAATSLPTLRALSVPLACAAAVAAAYASVFTIRTMKGASSPGPEPGHAFSIARAFGLAATVSAVMVLSAALQAWFGTTGLWVGAALAGFVDAHSAAVSVASLVASGKLPVEDATAPILFALSTNTVSKLIVAVTAGSPRFVAQVGPGLVLLVASAWIAFAVSTR
jgi:uncharacterized membrane protein (DUF4010 family)